MKVRAMSFISYHRVGDTALEFYGASNPSIPRVDCLKGRTRLLPRAAWKKLVVVCSRRFPVPHITLELLRYRR